MSKETKEEKTLFNEIKAFVARREKEMEYRTAEYLLSRFESVVDNSNPDAVKKYLVNLRKIYNLSD